jgi:hypothetical protein
MLNTLARDAIDTAREFKEHVGFEVGTHVNQL